MKSGNVISQSNADAAAPSTEGDLLRDMAVVERIRGNMETEDRPTLLAVESLVHLVRTYGALYERMNDVLITYGLSVAKFNLLIVLNTAPERRLPMSEIGERMSVTCANITKLVDGLERDGLVRRTNLPGDRRVVPAELTAEGEALLKQIIPEHYAGVKRLWAEMEESECLQLTHLLLKLRRSAQRADMN
jgi:MarR family transcriptional repressor of emrRAB